MIQMTFKKDYRQWKKGASYELGGGVSAILIERGIAYEAAPAAQKSKRKPRTKTTKSSGPQGGGGRIISNQQMADMAAHDKTP